MKKKSILSGILLAGPLIGGTLGIALSYLFRPMTLAGAPTIVAWLTEFIISKDFGPIILICGTTGSTIGVLVCWFIYLLSDLKNRYPIENRIWMSLFLLVLFIGVLLIIIIGTGLAGFFLSKERMLRFLHSLGPLSFVGFIILQAAQVIAAPVPGEVTGLLGGFLYGTVLGVILSTIGLTLGSYIAFTLGRSLGRPFVERVIDKKTMKRFDYVLHHKGAFLVFLLFLIPGFPKDYLCYFLGLGHLTTMEFLIIGGTGRLFGTILLTLGGSYIRNQQYMRFFVLAGTAIIVVLIAMLYRDRIERLFRRWHIISYRKKKAKRAKEGLTLRHHFTSPKHPPAKHP